VALATLSLTWTVKLNMPRLVGVLEITLVDELKIMLQDPNLVSHIHLCRGGRIIRIPVVNHGLYPIISVTSRRVATVRFVGRR